MNSKMLRFILSFLVFVCIFANPNCPKLKDDMINVHLVCHSHDDVGWLKTVDQYYYGITKSGTDASVQYIIDSALGAVALKGGRKFIYVESAYFFKWWDEQEESTKEVVKKLVENGQLEFAGGGWSMNDEACAYYTDIIDQMTLGISKLNASFGPAGIPKAAWQIDPFGHSYAQADLFAEMGFDGLFLGRIDYADMNNRMSSKTMEMIWKTQGSWNPAKEEYNQLFTGVLPNRYSPPDYLLSFDIMDHPKPIIDDKNMKDQYNADEYADSFLYAANNQKNYYLSNNLIMTMGNDFNYMDASMWFKNLDRLIKAVNAKQSNGSKVNVVYSTPSCYIDALNKENITWPVKKDDFLPYSYLPGKYWTGFYTSRPALKFYIRYAYPFLQSIKQLSSLSGKTDPSIEKLSEAMGVLQHHDAVSGTAKQHVTDDYNKILSIGIQSAQNYLSDTFGKLSSDNSRKFEFCNKLNVSECHFTENHSEFLVTLYNPSGHNQSLLVKLPVSTCKKGFKIVDKAGNAMPTQLLKIPKEVLKVPGRSSKAKCELYFESDTIPPLSTSEYYVYQSNNPRVLKEQLPQRVQKNENGETVLEIEGHKRIFKDNKIIFESNSSVPVTEIAINFCYYPESDEAGAYISIPVYGNCMCVIDFKSNGTYKGKLFSEQRFYSKSIPWISYIGRWIYSKPHLYEIEWLIGPIADGYDIISRYIVNTKKNNNSASFNSGKYFYTDSNGRGFVKREINHRDTWQLKYSNIVSQNYYPIASAILLKDLDSDATIGILNDRTQGGSSLWPGYLELMHHRRLKCDDGLGVEALNEYAFGKPLVVRGKHYITNNYYTGEYDSSIFRKVAQQIRLPPLVAFSEKPKDFKEWKKIPDGMKRMSDLPESIHLLSLEPWSHDRILLRLENFYDKYPVPSHPKISPIASVNIKTLFKEWDVVNIEELTLATGHIKKDKKPLVWNNYSPQSDQWSNLLEEMFGIYVFKPNEIRTFVLQVNRK